MPLHLTFLERALERFNLLPVPLLDAPLAPGIAKVLVTACETGVFDALQRGPACLDTLAEQLGCQPEGLNLLLQLLVTSGYLRQHDNTYKNTRMAKRWLSSRSPTSIAPYIVHSPDIVAIWDRLPEVLHTNHPVMRMPYEEDDHDPETAATLARHYAGLASLAMVLGGDVVNRVRLPHGASHLLDVGGSHAAYSVLFCRKHRHLQATVLDIQPGIEAGRRTAKQTGMEKRIDFVRGDIVRDDFSNLLADYPLFDVALYFHIAHLLPPDLNACALKKVAQSLKPGGLLVYLDQVTDQTHNSRLSSLMVQFMALTMSTIGGTCYPFPTVKCWLEQAGLTSVHHHRLLTPGATLITARKAECRRT